ncbi:unnamed protein product [Blepharisma stoltei]|uniref:Uncharacterized protein n=1 Tax=Blepharisma stoltei TaxID=1481888 RepID=A0AAU9JKW5_9CILI|nr:unnamed protein product [Blepharisma stoltei]
MRNKEKTHSLLRHTSVPTISTSHLSMTQRSPDKSSSPGLPILKKQGSLRKQSSIKKHVRIFSLGNDYNGLLDTDRKSFLEELTERYRDGFTNEFKKKNQFFLFSEIKATTGTIPESRVSGTMAYVNSFLYLYGGQSVDYGHCMKILDFRKLKWDHISYERSIESPGFRMGHTCLEYKNSLILYGGRSKYNVVLNLRECSHYIYKFDTGKLSWEAIIPEGNVKDGRRNHGAGILGHTMIIYGGIDSHGRILSSIHCLDLVAFKWFNIEIETTHVTPGHRHSFSFTPVFSSDILKNPHFEIYDIPYSTSDIIPKKKSGFYIFGGATLAESPSNDLYCLKVKKRLKQASFKWVKLETTGQSPSARSNHCSVFSGTHLYLIGGRNDTLQVSEKIEIYALDILELRWENVSIQGNSPTNRWGASAIAIGTKILILGGMTIGRYCNSDLYMIETDQDYVGEVINSYHEDEEPKKKIKEPIISNKNIRSMERLSNNLKNILAARLLANKDT